MFGPQVLQRRMFSAATKMYDLEAYSRNPNTVFLIFNEPLFRSDELIGNLGGADVTTWFSMDYRDD